MSKQQKNQEIIDFRYYLIDCLSGSTEGPLSPERNLTNSEKILIEKILLKYNIHFGIKYDLG